MHSGLNEINYRELEKVAMRDMETGSYRQMLDYKSRANSLQFVLSLVRELLKEGRPHEQILAAMSLAGDLAGADVKVS